MSTIQPWHHLSVVVVKMNICIVASTQPFSVLSTILWSTDRDGIHASRLGIDTQRAQELSLSQAAVLTKKPPGFSRDQALLLYFALQQDLLCVAI